MSGFAESARMAEVRDPVIPIIGKLARDTPGTVSFGQGVAHYGPPPEALAALGDFGNDPEHHKYHAVHGVPPLRELLRAKLETDNGIRLGRGGAARRLCVTAGGNMAFVNAALAIADPGNEIVLPVPFYFNHEMAVRMAGCRPVPVPTGENRQPVLEWIESAITPKTRAVLTVSPNNPSGAVYPEKPLREINALCGERGIFHIHDEAYEYFVHGDTPHFSPGSIEGSEAHTISLFSLSKTYGFASWRVGYMVYPAALENAIQKIQDTILICPPAASQRAAVGALRRGPDWCRGYLPEYRETRALIRDGLESVPDLCGFSPADGAFYVLARVHTNMSSMEMAKRLVTEHKVATMPGSAFGLEDGCYLRLSYGALRPDAAEEALGRLIGGLRRLAG